jgi:hypothetical protein
MVYALSINAKLRLINQLAYVKGAIREVSLVSFIYKAAGSN